MAQKKNRYHGEIEQLQTKLQSLRDKHQRFARQDSEDPDFVLLSKLDLDLEEEELQPLIDDIAIKAGLLAEHEENARRLLLAEIVERENNLPAGSLSKRAHDLAKPLTTIQLSPDASPTQQRGETISVHWQKYRAEKLGDGEWKSDRIARGFDVMLETFIEIVGNLNPSEITKQVCIKYKDGLREYQKKKDADTSSAKLEDQVSDGLALATRHNHMITISAFLSWLVDQELLQKNPIWGSKLIPKRDAREERRDPFTNDDLKLIFAQPPFRGAYKRNWQYWIPLLGLHSGGRIEELAQLRGMDVLPFQDVPGAWFLNICDREDFSGKTANAIRVIPVHAKLMELGFLDFVNATGKGHLFPAPPTGDGKRGTKMSNDFSRMKNGLGFGKKKVFHSFRNTVVDQLRRGGVNPLISAALIGHAQIGETNKRYGTAYHEELNNAVQKLNFDDVLANVEGWKENRP